MNRDRFELKYILDRAQSHDVVDALKEYIQPDARGDEYGKYRVTSLYYDTADLRAYWDKIEGHRFRRKVRVRIYGDTEVTPDARCFVEIKQRNDKTIQKRRILLPYSQAVALCGAGVFTQNGNTQDQNFAVIEEVRYLHDTLELRPTCVIGYDRLALAGTEYESDLRVTFDTDLTCRVNNPSLICRDNIHNHLFFPPQLCVMEIKIDHRVPYWLTEITAKFGCILRRISKYCTALEHTELPLTPF